MDARQRYKHRTILFCTQDTIEGVSDSGLIAVLLRGESYGLIGYQVPLGEFIHAYALGPRVH
jgi:hypothetical protein